MQLNHLDLQSADVQALAAFFVEHFELQRRSNDRSPAIAILADSAGFSLVIQGHASPVYPDGFHIGFIQPTVEAVTTHRERLVAAGLSPGPIDTNNRGTRFYIRGPGALLIEVSTPARS